MILMVLPGYPKGVMERNKVAEVITKIYAEVYGRPSHDPLLKSFIDEIPETVFLN